MDMEEEVAKAFVQELERQAEVGEGRLTVTRGGEGKLVVNGEIDLDALSMILVGTVAGGP